MVIFGSAAVCSLTTDSLQCSLIVTSCGLTAIYCIKRRYTQYARTNYRKFALGRGPVIGNVIPPRPTLQALKPIRMLTSSWKAHINKLNL